VKRANRTYRTSSRETICALEGFRSRKERKGIESLFKEIVPKNILTLERAMDIQNHEVSISLIYSTQRR
jgi:hypothetical protein